MVFDNENNKVGLYGGEKYDYTNYVTDPIEIPPSEYLFIIVMILIALVVFIILVTLLIKKCKTNHHHVPHSNNDYQRFNSQRNQESCPYPVNHSQPNNQANYPIQVSNAPPNVYYANNFNNQGNSNNANIQNSL